MTSRNQNQTISRKHWLLLLAVGGLAVAFFLLGWFISRGRQAKKAPVVPQEAAKTSPSETKRPEIVQAAEPKPATPVPVPKEIPAPRKAVPGQPFQQKKVALKDVGPFVTCLARDLQGNVWAGTEDKGVFRRTGVRNQESGVRQQEPSGGRKPPEPSETWTQFTTLGDDNAYALACDKLGRIWVGTLNHGVNVFNGKDWRNYDVLDGPIGERIFAIATCPTDGDVWLATSAGLTRYSLKNDTWSYYTRSDGLPSDQANALAFDQEGNLYVGTQCDGIAIARAGEEYKKWTQVSGPEQLPTLGRGEGLPCNLINALLVARNGTIYAGTTAGLARSWDRGKTWRYMRGRDYAAKVRGRVGGAPPGWQPDPPHKMDRLLPEDYVTCLAEDDAGLLWIGFRQQGYVAINPKNDTQYYRGTKETGLPDVYVNALLPSANLRHFIATYGGGLTRVQHAFKGVAQAKATTIEPAPLPAPAGAPTVAELKKMLKIVQGLPKTPTTAAYLGEDWTTQGDWVGRYGRQRAMLCAMACPSNHDIGWDSRYYIKGRIGPHAVKDDGLRLWVDAMKSNNPRSLYTPVGECRRDAVWDDHGEAYPRAHEGPDLWIAVTIPDGTYRLSLYFLNFGRHEGLAKIRDYQVELKPYSVDHRQADQAPVLARCRVSNFWGGVYKRFLITGPAKYHVKIAKNDSFNTMCQAIMIDRVRGKEEWWDKGALAYMERILYEPPVGPTNPPALTPAPAEALALWTALDEAYEQQASAALQMRCRLLAYRSVHAEQAPAWLLERWRWQLPLWSPVDRKEFTDTMAQVAEKARANKEATRKALKNTGKR